MSQLSFHELTKPKESKQEDVAFAPPPAPEPIQQPEQQPVATAAAAAIVEQIPEEPILEANPYKREEPQEEAVEEVAERALKKNASFKKGRPRSEKSRVAILKATNALLLHTSVQELSIEAIAKRAKVGKTTIYRWWPNKTAVVMEALSSQPAMNVPLPTARNNSEALSMQLEKLIRLLHSKNGATIAQLFSQAQGDDESQKIFENSFLGPLMDAIDFSIEQGKKDGEFRASLDKKLAIDILCGPIFFRLMAHPQDFDEDFEQRFPKQIVKVISA